MEIINVAQGSPEWLALRRNYCTASEAPAALGQSKYMSRTALLQQKHTGIAEEVGAAKQALYDRGHDTEAGARPLAEEIVGELYPITATRTVEGIALLASLDGITMGDDIIFEHKLYSESLAEDVRAGTLAPHYTIQMDQQLLVTGASKCLFMTSDGTRERMAWCWYETTPEKAAALLQGWRQFLADCAAYVPAEVVPAVVAAPMESLPGVSVRMEGSLTIASNLPAFGVALRAFIEKIPAEPSNDQEFADTDSACKALKKAEDALEAAEASALAGLANVEEMRRLVADYRNLARATRLAKEKQVEARKVQIRQEIVQKGQADFAEHMAALSRRLGKPYMPAQAVDFAGAIKNKRTVESLRDAVATTLANAKIAVNAIADRIDANLKHLAAEAGELAHLFPDVAALVTKQPDDFEALVQFRLVDHRAKEEKRLEAERERIRQEEAAKLQRAAAAPPPPPAPTPAPSVTPISPAVARQAVVEQQDVISAFLASRSWGRGEETKARAVLVEFEKFKAAQPLRRVA